MTDIGFKVCGFCGTEFQTKKKNQKYCDNLCCRGATNKRIMQRYYENKARLSGIKRPCSCGKLLSRYNTSLLCGPCELKNKDKNKDKILEAIGVIVNKVNKTKSK
jgi:hypothetical protein